MLNQQRGERYGINNLIGVRVYRLNYRPRYNCTTRSVIMTQALATVGTQRIHVYQHFVDAGHQVRIATFNGMRWCIMYCSAKNAKTVARNELLEVQEFHNWRF